MQDKSLSLSTNMTFQISPVGVDDVDQLARKVDYPAHRDGPLSRLIFPPPRNEEDEIRWTAQVLLQAVHNRDEMLYKACGPDGSLAGFIGWTTSPGVSSGTMAVNSTRDNTTGQDKAKRGSNTRGNNTWLPASLDVVSWVDVSRDLRDERQRVLQRYKDEGICRMSSPLY